MALYQFRRSYEPVLAARRQFCLRNRNIAVTNGAAGYTVRTRLKNNGGSYLSSHGAREVFGIGAATRVDELEIHWPAPSKRIEKLSNLAPNRYVHVVEGKGII
jgi:predicted NUDIX family NTP pyrophosphohydrolase